MSAQLQQVFQQGLAALQAGQFAKAETLFGQVLARDANHIGALCLNADVFAETNRLPKALEFLQTALRINATIPDIHNNLGVMLERAGKRQEAETAYRKAIAIRADFIPALSNLGIFLRSNNRFDEALKTFDTILKLNNKSVETLVNRAGVLRRLGRHVESLKSFDTALGLAPKEPVIHVNRGLLLSEMKRLNEALASFELAIKLRPNFPEAHLNMGVTLQANGKSEAALVAYDKALGFRPDFPEAHVNRGNALNTLKRYDEARTAFQAALKLRANDLGAQNGLAASLIGLGRAAESLKILDAVLAAKPDFAEAQANLASAFLQINKPREALNAANRLFGVAQPAAESYILRGDCYFALKRYNDALADFGKAIEHKPDSAELYFKRGQCAAQILDHTSALADYQSVQRIDPNWPILEAAILVSKVALCDWSNFDFSPEHIHATITRDAEAIPSLSVLALSLSEQVNSLAISKSAPHHFPDSPPAPIFKPRQRQKIHVGYFSADFREHATTYLMAELFELHDRDKFTWTAFAFGPDDKSALRNRIKNSFDNFIDVEALPDLDIAATARKLELDIAVDLKGYTQYERANIFAHRPAPIQVNYLGYPGSMFSPHYDYILADPMVIPPQNQPFFSEKIAYLPHSYLMNDRKRDVSGRVFSRAECGLPEKGFVFCCFNANHKILPEIFDIWMRILGAVDGSVLWLLQGSDKVVSNLRNEAYRRGINPSRLIFAPKMSVGDHIARQKLADLFLDTLPYNAHTTTIDALWAGLPVLTLLGETFPGRVAASLLTSIGMSELIAHSAAEYQAKAVQLAQNPEHLAQIKQKLGQNRDTTPLFDTAQTARDIEAAYSKMMALYDKGEAPQTFTL